MDYFTGQIILVPYMFGRIPSGFLPCNGDTLQVQQYEALYTLLGIQFGGNGSTTFNLPNLTAPVASNANGGLLQYLICWEGIYPNFNE